MSTTIATKLAGHDVAFSLLGGLSVSRCDCALGDAAGERPAPAAVAAQAPGYAFAASGAEAGQKWFTDNAASRMTIAAERQKMRAFRGLKPWSDSA